MEIRRLGAGDELIALRAIRGLKEADWSDRDASADAATPQQMDRFLSRDDHYLVVALDDGSPVGSALAYELARVDHDQTMMYLDEIYVAEPYQRRGIASGMVNLLKDFCRERNVMDMWVETNESNVAAVKLFQSTGGRRVDGDDIVHFGYTPEAY